MIARDQSNSAARNRYERCHMNMVVVIRAATGTLHKACPSTAALPHADAAQLMLPAACIAGGLLTLSSNDMQQKSSLL
jgi:hypothetical protein